MGGNVPLGYDASDRALVINPPSEDEIADVGVRSRLSAEGRRIRTTGPPCKRDGVFRDPLIGDLLHPRRFRTAQRTPRRLCRAVPRGGS